MNYYLFEEYLKEQRLTSQTIKGYVRFARMFIELNPEYLTYEYKDMIHYFSTLNDKYRREDGRVTATVTGIFYAIKLLYFYLVKAGVRDELPFPASYSIKGTRTRGLNTKKLFTPEELDQLMNFVRGEKLRFKKLELRNQVVMSLLIYQGLLCEEILKLTVDDIDLDNGSIYVAESVSANERTLSFHSTQFILMYDYIFEGRKLLLKDLTDSGKLVIGARPMTEQIGGIGRLLRKYRLLFPEREMTATVIRQSVIYNWLNHSKKSIETVQMWSGQKWPSTTERYLSKIGMEDPSEINGFHPMELL